MDTPTMENLVHHGDPSMVDPLPSFEFVAHAL